MTLPAFDPTAAAERARHLERRLSAAVQRIGDQGLVARVGRPLMAGSALELFALLSDEDTRVVTAAHECAMLRYGFHAAITAAALRFDDHARDDLVQRTFLDLPRAVRRTTYAGVPITNPEGWLRRRAYMIAHQMLREEHGTPLRSPRSGDPQRDERGQVMRSRGIRVPVDAIDETPPMLEQGDAVELERAELVHAALRQLDAERPLWAQVIRLHYLDSLPLDEIARRLGRTHGTVRNDVQRARLRLRGLIDEARTHGDDEPRREVRPDNG
ncbi:MAG: sigma-70 family RNA polymerase sigma factor [bacterium]